MSRPTGRRSSTWQRDAPTTTWLSTPRRPKSSLQTSSGTPLSQSVCPPPLRNLHSRTSRFRNNFFPSAVTLLNSAHVHTVHVFAYSLHTVHTVNTVHTVYILAYCLFYLLPSYIYSLLSTSGEMVNCISLPHYMYSVHNNKTESNLFGIVPNGAKLVDP